MFTRLECSALIISTLALTSCNDRRAAAPDASQEPTSNPTGGNAAPVVTVAPSRPTGAYQPLETTDMVRIDDKAYFLVASKWARVPGKSVTPIPVCWEPGTPSGPEREWVKEAVASSWQEHSTIRFIGFVDCAPASAGLRIAVRDDGPNDGPHTIGLGHFLDRKPNGMILNFTFRTWSPLCASDEKQRESCIRSIAVHEFGHAIGFAHEQNRPDTPGECTMKPQGQSGDVMLTPWDPHSVMNYCNPVYNNDGHLSAGDISGLEQMYP